MANVLVTGASGYAGGVIAARLRAAGRRVITAGRRAADDVRMDLRDPGAVAGLALPREIEACVHVAAAHEIDCREDPVAASLANVTATRALLQALENAAVSRIVYISTFHVFGNPAGVLNESRTPVPANDYGLTHWMAEQAMLLHGRRCAGADVHVLRPANLYGCPADWACFNRWTLAPFDFMRQAIHDGVIVLNSDGTAVRNYVSVDALAQATCDALDARLRAITHVAGRPWSMAELAALCARVATEETGGEITVRFGATATGGRAAQAFSFESEHYAEAGSGRQEGMGAFLRELARQLLKEGA